MTPSEPLIRLEPLMVEERRELLRLARASIRNVLEDGRPPILMVASAALTQPCAAFVSLHRDGQLRGCIGTLKIERPLHQTVSQMAVAAAFADPRFPPLLPGDLDFIEIEISRLSALMAARPDQVCPGRHGVCVSYLDRKGVFLPQVATLYNWDRERLLLETCRKADLPSDAWRWPGISLMIFEAEVFREGEQQA